MDGGGTAAAAPPTVRVLITHGNALLDVTVPAHSTFAELKSILAEQSKLDPSKQKLFFRGKEKGDGECLDMAGVRNGARLIMLPRPHKQDPEQVTSGGNEQKGEDVTMDEGMAKACEAVGRIQGEVDKLALKVSELESALNLGKKFDEKEFVILIELLMVQLLKLDGIEAEGAARMKRKAEVQRVQKLVEKLDALKSRNASPFSDRSREASVTTEWETFDAGTDKDPAAHFTNDWERFD